MNFERNFGGKTQNFGAKMADLRLRISIIEKNERGQEVELVRKTIQFKPQVICGVHTFHSITENMNKIGFYSTMISFFFCTYHRGATYINMCTIHCKMARTKNWKNLYFLCKRAIYADVYAANLFIYK